MEVPPLTLGNDSVHDEIQTQVDAHLDTHSIGGRPSQECAWCETKNTPDLE